VTYRDSLTLSSLLGPRRRLVYPLKFQCGFPIFMAILYNEPPLTNVELALNPPLAPLTIVGLCLVVVGHDFDELS